MGWKFKCNLLCLLNLYNRYWNQVHTKHKKLFSILVSKQKQAREKMQLIEVEVFIYLFTVFSFNSKALLVCVKDRVYLKVAIPAYCCNIFGSIFGVLYCLLIKKLILGNKTIWHSMRKFPCAVWSARTFPNMDKEKHFSQNCTLLLPDSF